MTIVNSTISFQVISFVSSSGNISLDNSSLISDAWIFNTVLTNDAKCLTKSGYCYYGPTLLKSVEVNSNDDWVKFESSDIYTLDALNTSIGSGDSNSTVGGGGRIVLGSLELKLQNNSVLSVNGFQADPKSRRRPEKRPKSTCFGA